MSPIQSVTLRAISLLVAKGNFVKKNSNKQIIHNLYSSGMFLGKIVSYIIYNPSIKLLVWNILAWKKTLNDINNEYSSTIDDFFFNVYMYPIYFHCFVFYCFTWLNYVWTHSAYTHPIRVQYAFKRLNSWTGYYICSVIINITILW